MRGSLDLLLLAPRLGVVATFACNSVSAGHAGTSGVRIQGTSGGGGESSATSTGSTSTGLGLGEVPPPPFRLDLSDGDWAETFGPGGYPPPPPIEYDDPALLTVCGDSLHDLDEGCDDGNLVAGDGCDATCQLEPGWSCIPGPVPWVFENPTRDGEYGGEVFPGWEVSRVSRTSGYGPTYYTAERDCLRNFLRSAAWITNAPSGCGSMGSSGSRYYRTTFNVTAAELASGPIEVGIGWDNHLLDIWVNDVALGEMRLVDGWPSPRFRRTLGSESGVVPGENTIVLHVHEVSTEDAGPDATFNFSGVSFRQIRPDICGPRVPPPEG